MNQDEKILAMLTQMNDRIAQMSDSIAELQQGQAELKEDIRKIDRRTMRVEKEHGLKINGIYESLVGAGETHGRLDRVENRVGKLEDDVFAIKQEIAN